MNNNETTSTSPESQTASPSGETVSEAEKITGGTKKGTGYSFTVDETKWKLMKQQVGSTRADGGDNIFTYHNEYEFQYIGGGKAASNCIISVLVIDINEDVLNQSAEGTGEDIDTAMTDGITDIGRAIASQTVDLAGDDQMLADGETTFCGRKAYKFKYSTKLNGAPVVVTNVMAYNKRKILLFSTYGFSGADADYEKETETVRDSFSFE